jgi:periplasmic protein CpxP/Spy
MRLYKYSLIAALALGSLLVSTTVSSAQDTKGGKKGRATVEQRVERMTTELKLNDSQKTKVTSLLEADQKKMQELRADTSLSQEQRREKFRALRDESDKKMKEILTSDQWEKLQKSREQMKGERKGKKKE